MWSQNLHIHTRTRKKTVAQVRSGSLFSFLDIERLYRSMFGFSFGLYVFIGENTNLHDSDPGVSLLNSESKLILFFKKSETHIIRHHAKGQMSFSMAAHMFFCPVFLVPKQIIIKYQHILTPRSSHKAICSCTLRVVSTCTRYPLFVTGLNQKAQK